MAVDFYDAFANVIRNIITPNELINVIYNSSIYNGILSEVHQTVTILLVTITLYHIFKIFAWDMVFKKGESTFEDILLLLYQKGVPFIIAGVVLIPTPWTGNLGLLEYTFREGTKIGFTLASKISQTSTNNFFAIPLDFVDKVIILGDGRRFREYIKDPKFRLEWDAPTPPEWAEAGKGGKGGVIDFFVTAWEWLLTSSKEGKDFVWEFTKKIVAYSFMMLVKALLLVFMWLIENSILLLGFMAAYFYYFVEAMVVVAKMTVYSLLAPLTVLCLFFERFSGMFWDLWRKFLVLILIPSVLVFSIFVALHLLGIYYFVIMRLLGDTVGIQEAFHSIYGAAGAVAYFALVYFLFKRLLHGSQVIVDKTTSQLLSVLRSVLGSE